MTTLTKIIVTSILSMLMFSCNFNIGTGVSGNGIVKSTERTLEGDFNTIEVSRGLDVYITQSDSESLKVQADENLHDIIKTIVENNTLKIYANENISYAASKKVFVSFNSISKLSASSGSDMFSTNTITVNDLELSTESGSDMTLDINVQSLRCDSSSGSDLKLTGKTESFYANASSGSDIKAGDLVSTIAEAKASSGSDITLNTTKELTANASSGGDIKYYGNPEKVNKSDNVSGSVNKQ